MIERAPPGRLRQHAQRYALCEEQRAAKVDRQHPVVVLGRQLQKVAAHGRGDAGVVDEAVDAAEALDDLIERRRVAWRDRRGRPGTNSASAPRARSSSAAAAPSGSTSVIARSKLSASLTAIARPMPRPAPVTMATGRDDAVMVSSRCGD